ncbi:hypothetical protein C8F04DRAFT_1235573 [Mycena alexandri]|uniref:Uncharacterized protein n=1 Tax=Mycena alexandri TaxID=1745969 RepID=A0AAD6SQL2_9AGAR|nr:hypothetical protein C8F04DRAFT_1235573 [Mycena alexandri]
MRVNLLLGPRGPCRDRDCSHSCAAFVAANLDGSPKYSDFERSDLACFVCDHTWLSHTPDGDTSAQNSLFARGGTSGGCAEFFSLDTVWNMRSICVCTLPWSAHSVLTSSGSQTSTTSAPAPRPAVPDLGATPSHRHAPTTAFTGLPRPPTTSIQNTRASTVRDTVNAQRRVSIQRTLHSNDAGGSTITSTSSAAATTPTRSRKSGPPRPYSTALDDFAAAPVAAITSVPVTIGILPKVLDTSDHNDMLDLSPLYSWKGGEDLERAQTALQRANLVFVVDVDVNGPIFQTIDTGFKTHCRIHNIQYVAPTGSSSDALDTPNTKAWVLLGPKPKGRSGGARVWVEDPKGLTRFTFTLQALRSLPFSYTANHLGQGPFAFVAPRLRNLTGPIDSLFDARTRLPEHVLPHRCFARRVCYKILPSLAGDPEPACGPSCTPGSDVVLHSAPRVASPEVHVMSDSDDDSYLPEPGSLLDEIDHPQSIPSLPVTSTIITRSVRRQQWQQEAIATAAPIAIPVAATPGTLPFIPGPLLAAAMDLSSVSVKTRSFLGPTGALDLTLQHMPGSGLYSLGGWQDYMLSPSDTDASLTAGSVDEGARVLIALLIWLFAGRPTGLKFREVIHELFPSPRPTVDRVARDLDVFALRVTIESGTGPGPRNEIVGEAIKILLADSHFWTEREDYHVLRLHPSRTELPARACVLKATGFLFLLHFLFIGAPASVSPFIFSTLFDGRKTASKFDEEFLARFVSPRSLSLVTKIQQTPLTSPLYASSSESCVEYQFLVNIPDFDPTMVSMRRSREEHDGICGTVISYITLGTVDIEHHPDFLFMADGFNIIMDALEGREHPHHMLEWFATPCRELILAAFDRRIKSPADIVSHLEFAETNPEENPWGENEETVGLITRFVTHYLMEPGHPVDPDRVIHALISNGDGPADPILRATLFLLVLTGSTTLPVRPTWKAKCLITHDWSQQYPTTDADGRDDYGPDVAISFRSCFKTFTITNNARLRHLLLSETPVQGQDTQLGRLIHAQLLASRGSYTAA